jgi:hypothetical protein
MVNTYTMCVGFIKFMIRCMVYDIKSTIIKFEIAPYTLYTYVTTVFNL